MTTLTTCRLTIDGVHHSMGCNLAVVYRIGDNYGQLYALSVAGHAQYIQAATAALGDHSLCCAWPKLGVKRWEQEIMPATGGFECRKVKLAYDTWHLVAVSQEPKFLLHESDDALWQLLRSDKFTTPLLRSWVPELRKMLKERSWLKRLDFFGPCTPAYVGISDQQLDELVSQGLRFGRLKIPAAVEAAA